MDVSAITPVTSGSNAAAVEAANQINQLQLQQTKLEQQMQKISAGNDKTKAQELLALQLQIDAIAAQIAQLTGIKSASTQNSTAAATTQAGNNGNMVDVIA